MHSNKGSLSSIEKLDYFISWFGEFSEMEKGDFLEIIAKKYNDQVDTDSYNSNLTMGFKKLELNDRLPSIFKCRIQLFDQWFNEWSMEEKEQILVRIKNLDNEFSEKLERAKETGKLPQNNLLYCSYEISDEMYEELRKNHQLTSGNSLNSISSIDLLNTSNDLLEENDLSNENGMMNGNLTNGRKDETSSLNSLIYQNGHTNGLNGLNDLSNGLHHSTSEEETDQLNHNLEQEDSIDNQISSLETDNVQNGDAFNESIELESTNDNL